MAFVIHVMVRNDNNVNKLDTVRLYTMVREKGNVASALSYISSWTLSDACAKTTNLTLQAGNSDLLLCSTGRRDLRNNILNAMKCDVYNSQVCAALQKILTGVAGYNTTNTGILQGKDLTAKPPGYDLTYKQIIYNSVQEAPNVLHNAFYAKQEKDWILLRTTIYNLIALSVLANIVVHIVDSMPGWSWNWRLGMRVGLFLVSFFVSIILAFASSGSIAILFIGIFTPAIINLIYFELFLDDSEVRPWVHPYTFTVVFACLSLLALTENDVLNLMVVTLELLKAHAAAQLYMEVVWYWTGYMEKKRMGSDLVDVYKTKQIQFALFMGIVLVALFPFLQYMAPYDYTDNEPFLKIAPLLFTGISVIGTIFLQSLIVDDYYGTDAYVEKSAYQHGPMRPNEDRKMASWAGEEVRNKPYSITGGKLAVSALLLIFIALVEAEFLAEYFRTMRAYYDIMPEKAFQYDPLNTRGVLTGAGLYMPSVYLSL